MATPMDPKKMAAWIKELTGLDVDDPKHLRGKAQELKGTAIMELDQGRQAGRANPDKLAEHVHNANKMNAEAAQLETKATVEQKKIDALEAEFKEVKAAGGQPVKAVTVRFKLYKSHEGFDKGTAVASFSNNKSGKVVKRTADIDGGELKFLDMVLEPKGEMHLEMNVPNAKGKFQGSGKWTKLSDHMIFEGHQDGRDVANEQQNQRGGKTGGSHEDGTDSTVKNGVNLGGSYGHKHTGGMGVKVNAKEDIIVEGAGGEVTGNSGNENTTGVTGGLTHDKTDQTKSKDDKNWERTNGGSSKTTDKNKPERGFGFALQQVQ